MAHNLISPDGRYWWDGTQWRSRLVEGELDLFWFTTSPEWFQRILITGLINLIPIVGAMNTYGWTLTAVDRVRQRWRELPPAGFHYIERGLAPFVVGLVYGLVAIVVIGVLGSGAVLLAISDHGRIPVAIALGALALLLAFGWWLLMLFLFGAIVVGSDRLGIGRAINPKVLWSISRANSAATLSAALIYLLGSLVVVGVGSVVGFIVPFGSLLASLALPAVFAMIVPPLAKINVESESS